MDDGADIHLPWLRYLLIFGRNPPALTWRQWKMILLLGGCGFFASYDGMIFTLALVQIQRDFNVTDDQVSFMSSLIALGPLFSLPFLLGADRYGRRVVLLITVAPYSVFTGLTALCYSAAPFVICQFLASVFLSAEGLVSHVVIIEEMPGHCRGWAVGVISSFAAFGSGFALLLFGFLGDRPGGWRVLYVAALAPLLLLACLRRFLPETGRFHYQKAIEHSNGRVEIDGCPVDLKPIPVSLGQVVSPSSSSKKTSEDLQDALPFSFGTSCLQALKPLRELFLHSRSRALGVLALCFVDSFAVGAQGLYEFKYLQSVHSFTAAHVSILGILGGLLSLGTFTLAGELSDRLGRRRLLAFFLVMHSIFVCMYFSVPAGTAGSRLVSVLWTFKVACGMGMGTLFTALFAEVFPTMYRSTAQSLGVWGSSLGRPLGIFAEGVLAVSFGNHWRATAVVASMRILSAVLAMRCFPETAGRELEEINDEPCGA